MRRYLIHSNGVGAYVDVPSEIQSEGYGRIQREFCQQHGSPDEKYATMVTLWHHCERLGVYWDEELAGPDGMSYMLIQTPGITGETLKKVKNEIRTQHDVVRMHVLKIKKIVEFDPKWTDADKQAVDMG